MAIEPLVVRQLCADDPNSIPRQPQALVMDGPVYKREQLSCCHPPIVTSINHISLSMFNFMGSLCFLKCVKLPWADFLAHPLFSAVGTTVGTRLSRLWCSFCLKQAKEWAWRGACCFLASLSFPFQMSWGSHASPLPAPPHLRPGTCTSSRHP